MNIPPSVSYSVRRLALFAATVLFVSVVLPGVDPIVKLAIAAIISGVLSYFVLSGPRKAMARSVEAKVKGLNQRIDERAASEDAILDAAERSGTTPLAAPNQGESAEDATRRESRS
jgi:hypothetical protein